MTYPRSHLVDPEGGLYHLYSRCVRRAFLCGRDKYSGRNYDHRKRWLERRLRYLANLFAVDLYGYAILSNHYHLVVAHHPRDPFRWSDLQVAERWAALTQGQANAEAKRARIKAIASSSQLVAVYRRRLGSLSWFMRFLNEGIARSANHEDDCTGRFWEGRFKSQRLLDDNALLACLVYVDLNPVRAGESTEVLTSKNTSLAARVREAPNGSEHLASLCETEHPSPFDLSLKGYIKLVKWTAHRSNKSPRPRGKPPPKKYRRCMDECSPVPNTWPRALGNTQQLAAYASRIGQRWVKRVSSGGPA